MTCPINSLKMNVGVVALDVNHLVEDGSKEKLN